MAVRYIIFGSETIARKAKMVLTRGGMTAEIVKTPEKYGRRSCSYSIKTSDINMALTLLERAGIPIVGKY